MSTSVRGARFGCTLLAQEAVAALGIGGLDPAAGFLHRARWGLGSTPLASPGMVAIVRTARSP